MINITNIRDCCGCKACGDICTHNAIKFKSDDEGFWYPVVDIASCVDCGLCERVCPVNHSDSLKNGNFKNPQTIIMQHKNVAERFNSTSGCVYPEIASWFLQKGHYVAGHIFNDDFSVRGYVTNNIDDLQALRTSKYLQSDMAGVYKKVKQLLLKGEKVLFSGCPCQIAAIKTYLNKDFENLLTVDFTCMGIDSPMVFKKYIESLEKRYNSKVVFFKSKCKETGWRDLTNKMIFESGKTYFGTRSVDPNLKATFLDIQMRPACFECKFKGLPRIADITIGDYWHRPSIKEYEIDDNTGTSYYIANSLKGLDFLENIKDQFRTQAINVDVIIKGNPYMLTCLPEPNIDRTAFYRDVKERDFTDVVNELFEKVNRKNKTKQIIFQILRAFKRLHLNPYLCLRYIYYNFFNSRVKIDHSNSSLLMYRNFDIKIEKGSVLTVSGFCSLGKDSVSNSRIKIKKNSQMHIDKLTTEGGSVNIIVGENSKLRLGHRTILAEGTHISCLKQIIIGDYSYLGRNSYITDNNDQIVRLDSDNLLIEPVNIGAHCYIGHNTLVKRGSIINDEVIVEDNSTVDGNIPPRVVIRGNPAQIINKNILWKK